MVEVSNSSPYAELLRDERLVPAADATDVLRLIGTGVMTFFLLEVEDLVTDCDCGSSCELTGVYLLALRVLLRADILYYPITEDQANIK